MFKGPRLSFSGAGLARLLRKFIAVKKNIEDTRQNVTEDDHIKISPDDVHWWLKDGPTLENDAYVSGGKAFVAQRKVARQFERYVELILGDRTKPELVDAYEARIRAGNFEPWRGEMVKKIVKGAKQIRDEESAADADLNGSTTTVPKTKLALRHGHFVMALDEVVPATDPTGLPVIILSDDDEARRVEQDEDTTMTDALTVNDLGTSKLDRRDQRSPRKQPAKKQKRATKPKGQGSLDQFFKT